MKTQKSEFALTSLHNFKKKTKTNKKTPSNSDNKSGLKNTNVDI